MTYLVVCLIVFVTVAVIGLAANLFVGYLVRPNHPSPEKGEIYECGESPIGSAWIQFDLRFYVVALLFVIFDVELAFFFPWAVVFGTANQLTNPNMPEPVRIQAIQRLDPSMTTAPTKETATTFARFAFVEMMVFFGILMVGFAYLWARGDLEWIRSLASQSLVPRRESAPPALELPSP